MERWIPHRFIDSFGEPLDANNLNYTHGSAKVAADRMKAAQRETTGILNWCLAASKLSVHYKSSQSSK